MIFRFFFPKIEARKSKSFKPRTRLFQLTWMESARLTLLAGAAFIAPQRPSRHRAGFRSWAPFKGRFPEHHSRGDVFGTNKTQPIFWWIFRITLLLRWQECTPLCRVQLFVACPVFLNESHTQQPLLNGRCWIRNHDAQRFDQALKMTPKVRPEWFERIAPTKIHPSLPAWFHPLQKTTKRRRFTTKTLARSPKVSVGFFQEDRSQVTKTEDQAPNGSQLGVKLTNLWE